MKFPIFFSNIYETFTISQFSLNEPIHIMLKDKFLSCSETKNVVDFFLCDDNSGRQKWIIESEDDYFYIKTSINRKDSTKYLGCPNKNDQAFLYTSKTKFTRWNIACLEDSSYKITYAGEKFDANQLNIVIARYKENLDWALPYNDIAFIYNKGPPDVKEFSRILTVKNVGREGHTYLYHIIANYDNLAQRTIFLQGDWFEHNETILYGIDNYEKHLPVQPMGLVYLRRSNIPPVELEQRITKKTKYGLNYLVINVTGDHDYAGDHYFYDEGVKHNIREYKKENPHTSRISLFDSFLFLSKFPRHLNPLPTTQVPSSYSGLFSVNKRNILLYGKDVYINIIKELLRLNLQGGTNGYVLERLWLWIFQYS